MTLRERLHFPVFSSPRSTISAKFRLSFARPLLPSRQNVVAQVAAFLVKITLHAGSCGCILMTPQGLHSQFRQKAKVQGAVMNAGAQPALELRPPEEILIEAKTPPGTTSLAEILKSHGEWLSTNGQNGERAVLEGANLERADLRQEDLRGANLRGAKLTKASLCGADLSALLRPAEKGASHSIELTDTDLSGADLSEADLSADLSGAKPKETALRGANLTGADLIRANLTQADLTGADLTRAKLNGAILERTNFRNNRQR